jgi:hypothetical protein
MNSIPYELYEAARIDGAGHVTTFVRIVLPLGKPILVTIALFSGLAYWNDWTNGLYYVTTSRMLSIQALLNRMIQDIQALAANSTANSGAVMMIPQVSIRMAIAFVAILPILVFVSVPAEIFCQWYHARCGQGMMPACECHANAQFKTESRDEMNTNGQQEEKMRPMMRIQSDICSSSSPRPT